MVIYLCCLSIPIWELLCRKYFDLMNLKMFCETVVNITWTTFELWKFVIRFYVCNHTESDYILNTVSLLNGIIIYKW